MALSRCLPFALLPRVWLRDLRREHVKLLLCPKEVRGQRKVWGVSKLQPDGPELVGCFGGLKLADDNRKACEASLPFLGNAYYCAAR